MKDTTLPRWITLSEASQYSGFSCDIIEEALLYNQLTTNLVFRTRGGVAERLIDRHSLDEWIGRYVPVPCSHILTKDFLKRIPDGCYVVSNTGTFSVHIKPGMCRDSLWHSAVEKNADFIRAYVTRSISDFEILRDGHDRWHDEEFVKHFLAVEEGIPMLDDAISLAQKVS